MSRDGDSPPTEVAVAPEVDLVREYKGPTVDQVLTAAPSELDLLPGRVQSMEQAARDNDLVKASRHMEQAVGSLLNGPGHPEVRRSWLVLPVVAWLWLAALLGVFAWVVV